MIRSIEDEVEDEVSLTEEEQLYPTEEVDDKNEWMWVRQQLDRFWLENKKSILRSIWQSQTAWKTFTKDVAGEVARNNRPEV